MSQSSEPYFRKNAIWPVQRAASGLRRAGLTDRAEAQLRHLIGTPKGSLIYDKEYGTDFYLLRTQNMTLDDTGESAPGGPLVHITKAGFMQQASKYVPDVAITSVSVDADFDQQRWSVTVSWELNSAESSLPAHEARPREMTVLI